MHGQDLGQFASKPFNAWIKMSEKAAWHAKKDYHLTAMTRMKEFLTQYENPSQVIHTLLDSKAKRMMESNQKVIESLLKIVLLCGMQGLTLRGHRDDTVNWEGEEGSSNNGNFVQLVRCQAETGPILANHREMPITHPKPFKMN